MDCPYEINFVGIEDIALVLPDDDGSWEAPLITSEHFDSEPMDDAVKTAMDLMYPDSTAGQSEAVARLNEVMLYNYANPDTNT